MTSFINLVLTCAAFGILCSCAEVAPPPGGEEDTVGPQVIASEPADGATNVPTDNTITIHFSERILKPTVGNAVAVSPRPSAPPKLKWGSNRLTVIFPDSFQANKTYTISFTAGITDLRRKSIEGKSSISFSTGATIDSGHLSGRLLQGNEPAQKMTVALFQNIGGTGIVVDSTYPDYQLSTDKNGRFAFANIADGSYHLIAFEDRNRNEYFDRREEPFALPDRSIIVDAQHAMDSLTLRMQPATPDSLRLVDATVTRSRLIRARLSRSLPIDDARLLVSQIALIPVDRPSQSSFAKGFQEQDSLMTSLLTLDFGTLPVGVCSLAVPVAAGEMSYSKRQVTIDESADSEQPQLVRIFPAGTMTAQPDSFIAIFSEPIRFDSAANAMMLVGKDDDSIPLTVRPLSSFAYSVHARALQPSEQYHLSLDSLAVTDRAGNHILDTVTTRNIRVLPEDSLGSAAGTITNALYPDSLFSAVLYFVPLRSLDTFTVSGTRSFTISLPSGKYQIVAFVDRNLDRRPNFGSLTPFVPAEQYLRLVDTIAVRPRFETSGIEINFR